MRTRLLIAALPLLALVACAKPTTMNPTFTPDELKREQQAQDAAAKAAQAQGQTALSSKKYSPEEVNALAARLEPIAAKVEQAAVSVCRDMRGAGAKCQYKVILDAKEVGLNAHADGQNVVINPAMIDFAKNDTHLAFVIAHEFGHNIMGHIAAQQKNVALGGILGTLGDALAQSQGYQTNGAFGKIGAQQGLLRYSPDFENEADYVGLYILARTGYPIEPAPDFWRQMSVAEPRSIYVTGTHPNNPSRTIAMEKTIQEINGKRAVNQPLLPNIRPKA